MSEGGEEYDDVVVQGDVDETMQVEEEKEKGQEKKGQRAIGVVYNPEYEKYWNYVPTILAKRMMHFYLSIKHMLYIHYTCQKLKIKRKIFQRPFLLDYNTIVFMCSVYIAL